MMLAMMSEMCCTPVRPATASTTNTTYRRGCAMSNHILASNLKAPMNRGLYKGVSVLVAQALDLLAEA
eukprot:3887097-Prorocentrum_lima.AAC.1